MNLCEHQVYVVQWYIEIYIRDAEHDRNCTFDIRNMSIVDICLYCVNYIVEYIMIYIHDAYHDLNCMARYWI